jgi:hypothetical protein
MAVTEKVRKAAGNRGQGRKPGVPNKVTTEFRDTIRRLLEDNADNIAKWVAQVANGTPAVRDRDGNVIHPARPGDPGLALGKLAHLAEFAAPKLTRAEVTGPGGGDLTVVIKHLGTKP